MTKLEFDLYNKAIISLFPRKPKFALRNKEIISWTDEEYEQPTKEQFQAKLSELQADYDAKKYLRDRQLKYPNTKDLIVALWEKVVEGRSESADALEVKRQQIKTAHPKPE